MEKIYLQKYHGIAIFERTYIGKTLEEVKKKEIEIETKNRIVNSFDFKTGKFDNFANWPITNLEIKSLEESKYSEVTFLENILAYEITYPYMNNKKVRRLAKKEFKKSKEEAFEKFIKLEFFWEEESKSFISNQVEIINSEVNPVKIIG